MRYASSAGAEELVGGDGGADADDRRDEQRLGARHALTARTLRRSLDDRPLHHMIGVPMRPQRETRLPRCGDARAAEADHLAVRGICGFGGLCDCGNLAGKRR